MRPIEFEHETPNGASFATTVEFIGDTIRISQENPYDDDDDEVLIDIHKMNELIAAYERYRSSATE